MDPAERERLRTQIQIMQDPRLVRGILWLVISLPMIGLVSVFAIGQEIVHLCDAWPWRDAIETLAVVSRHDVESKVRDLYFGYYEHSIDYNYSAGPESISMTLTADSPSDSAIYFGEDKFQLAKGSRFRIFYQPRSPSKHQILVDPRGDFWGSAGRLGVIGGFIAASLLVILFIWRTYRPKKRIAANAKFSLPPELAATK